MAEKNDFTSLNIDRVQFGRNPDGTRLSLEEKTKNLNLGIERSALARGDITNVFDRFGVPLAASLDGKKDFPITIEGGGEVE